MVSRGSDDSATEAWRRRMPPDNEVCGTVAVDAVVTRNDDVAVTLRFLLVHSNGVVVSLVLQRRFDPDPAMRHETFHTIDADVLIGVELSDGSTATSAGGRPLLDADPTDAQAPLLQPHGGGGGDREYEMSYWLTPLPPPGDLVVLVASVPLGLPEGRVVVPANALAEAADRRRTLWPREPDRPYEPGIGRRPEVPGGGWFARVLGIGQAQEV
jgi:hypothetical protein